MAVAFDASGGGGGGGVTSVSFSVTCSGSDRAMAFLASWRENATVSVSAASYNSVAASQVSGAQATNGTYKTDIWQLVAPATGSNTASMTFSSSSNFEVQLCVVSATGVDQTTPVGTAATATGSSTTPSVSVTSETDGLVVDVVTIVHSGTFSVGAGQTQRRNTTVQGWLKQGVSTEPGAASVTMSWSNTSSETWAISAVPFKPVAAASTASHFLCLLGVGT